MMTGSIHQIAVSAPSDDQSHVFLAAVMASAQSMVAYQGLDITVSIRDRGKELLFNAERIEAEMKASSQAKAFDLHEALKFPERIPDSLELSIQTDQQFIGRLHFFCFIKENSIRVVSHMADAIIIIIPESGAPEERIAEFLEKSDAGVCFAVKCEKKPEENDSAEQYVKTTYPDLYQQTTGRLVAYHWYDPKGFSSDGSQRSEESAVPLGMQGIFWDSARIAASGRLAFLRKTAEEQQHIICRRNSWFQKNSVRRQLELNQAREAYSDAVMSMYGAEQILALTQGKPLAEDSDLKGELK